MRTLSQERVTVRLTESQRARLMEIASEIGSAGNLSAGLRWCVENPRRVTKKVLRGKNNK